MTENRDKVARGLLGIHAQTPLHPGAGAAIGAIDLPVQREKHTHWPTIGGSAIKGILRDACRERVKGNHAEEKDEDGKVLRSQRRVANAEDKELVTAFGPDSTRADEHAGALSVTDARLLAFPVRSLKGVFAWVTCRAVLERFQRDAHLAGHRVEIPDAVPSNHVAVAEACPCLFGANVVLEEFDFKQADNVDATPIANWIAENVLPSLGGNATVSQRFRKHLVILHDDDFTHFARHATEVTARIGLNYDTKTVNKGALFYQEFLPAETLLYSVVLANTARAKTGNGKPASDVLGFIDATLAEKPVLQIGGDETIGKGFCAVKLAIN